MLYIFSFRLDVWDVESILAKIVLSIRDHLKSTSAIRLTKYNTLQNFQAKKKKKKKKYKSSQYIGLQFISKLINYCETQDAFCTAIFFLQLYTPEN